MLARIEQVEHLLVVYLEVRGLEFARVAGAHAVEERAAEARDETGAGAERVGRGDARRGRLVRISSALSAANASAHHRVGLAGTYKSTSENCIGLRLEGDVQSLCSE